MKSIGALRPGSRATSTFDKPGKPNPNEPFARTPRIYWTLCVLMLVLILLYVGRGVWTYATDPVIDTDRRWQEVHTMLNGVDPNTLNDRILMYQPRFLEESGVYAAPPFLREFSIPGRQYAIGVYPSYTYAMAIPLVWPDSMSLARLWFFPTTLISLLIVGLFIHAQYRNTLPGAQSQGLVLLPVATLCAASLMDIIHTGNYTLIVIAALIGMFISMQKNRPVQPGLWLALAMIKPTLAVPFGLILLVRRRFWPGIAACTLIVLFFVGLAYALTETSPIASMLGALGQADQFVDQGGGLNAMAVVFSRFSAGTSTILVATFVCLTGLLALFLTRHKSLHLAFAIAAVVSIVCTYHRSYDHLIILFMLLYIGRNILLLKHAGAKALVESGLFFLVVATLILPYSLVGGNGTNAYREIVWVGCLTVSVLMSEKVLAMQSIRVRWPV